MASPNSEMSDNGNATPTLATNSNAGNYGGINSDNTTTATTNYSSTTAVKDLDRNTLKKTVNLENIEKLSYTIHRYSSFSTNYVPE